jgi:hypothetical protein
MADLPGEPGWYRLTDHGWEHVDAARAQAEYAAMAPGYEDLVYFDTTPPAMAEDPLF